MQNNFTYKTNYFRHVTFSLNLIDIKQFLWKSENIKIFLLLLIHFSEKWFLLSHIKCVTQLIIVLNLTFVFFLLLMALIPTFIFWVVFSLNFYKKKAKCLNHYYYLDLQLRQSVNLTTQSFRQTASSYWN